MKIKNLRKKLLKAQIKSFKMPLPMEIMALEILPIINAMLGENDKGRKPHTCNTCGGTCECKEINDTEGGKPEMLVDSKE